MNSRFQSTYSDIANGGMNEEDLMVWRKETKNQESAMDGLGVGRARGRLLLKF